MADLVSSVPGIYDALFGLVQEAASEQTPEVEVFPFAVMQSEPSRYIQLTEIKGPEYEWAAIGSFAQTELYDICGRATVFTGDSIENDPALALAVLGEAFALLQTCVMTPVMSHRNMPFLGTTGPTPYSMLPLKSAYSAGPGNMAGGPAGWEGTIEWGFRFEAHLTPG